MDAKPYNVVTAIDDLDDWEEENDDILPIAPAQIVALEKHATSLI